LAPPARCCSSRGNENCSRAKNTRPRLFGDSLLRMSLLERLQAVSRLKISSSSATLWARADSLPSAL
jgi:hypothetical protein